MSWAAAPDVAWTVDADPEELPRIILARVPDGEPVVLAGSAGQIWLLALECADLDEVVTHLADLTVEPEGSIRPPIADLLDDLVTRGLLTTPAR